MRAIVRNGVLKLQVTRGISRANVGRVATMGSLASYTVTVADRKRQMRRTNNKQPSKPLTRLDSPLVFHLQCPFHRDSRCRCCRSISSGPPATRLSASKDQATTDIPLYLFRHTTRSTITKDLEKEQRQRERERETDDIYRLTQFLTGRLAINSFATRCMPNVTSTPVQYTQTYILTREVTRFQLHCCSITGVLCRRNSPDSPDRREETETSVQAG